MWNRRCCARAAQDSFPLQSPLLSTGGVGAGAGAGAGHWHRGGYGTAGDPHALRQRIPHEQAASCVARFHFGWLNHLLNTGNARQLDFDDLDPLPEADDTHEWAARFEAEVIRERRRVETKRSLLRVLNTVFGGEWYVIISCFLFCLLYRCCAGAVCVLSRCVTSHSLLILAFGADTVV